jgi:phenylalanyl-tRNA synthetase beta chain
MNISYNWLNEYLNKRLETEELSSVLTGCGLEVESVEKFESVKGGLRGLIVGEVIKTEKHPNADRLTVCDVNIGNSISRIVCGAPNVAPAQKVIIALPGTTIFPTSGEPFEIKNSKIRGEVSEGMICAEDEIGLGTSHAGIMILPGDAIAGTPVTDYLKIESDYIFSIGLTPNRSDAASHIGVARDIAAVLNVRKDSAGVLVNWPDLSAFTGSTEDPKIQVSVTDKDCIRYSGIHIEGIKVEESPEWLKNRLRAVGLKPINNIVDITNFVMFETGQPLHAFDASLIRGQKVTVKKLPAGSQFITLDNIPRTLDGNELMICDDEGGLCIAGVFGGIHSGVSSATNQIFLESACFDPVSVRKTSKTHGLKTDASFRFERGTDPEITITALKRASVLISQIANGKVTSGIVDIYPEPVINSTVRYSLPGLEKLAGTSIPKSDVSKILESLDIKVKSDDGLFLQLEVPSYRVDVKREADITEEILRIYGYDRIPVPSKMNSSLPGSEKEPLENIRKNCSSYLISNGFFEVMNNSLVNSSTQVLPGSHPQFAKIKNPLSRELDVLRTNMLFPLLNLVLYNRNRKREDIRVFEFGKIYERTSDGYSESNRLAVLMAGDRYEENWQGIKSGYSIYFLKSLAENLGPFKKSLQWEPYNNDFFSEGIVQISGKNEIIKCGLVNSSILRHFDLDGKIWFLEINLDHFARMLPANNIKISEPPKFPEVRRDLSLLLDKAVNYERVKSLAYEMERKLLKDVFLFDVYEGEKIDASKKSYALGFILRDDERTLTDKDIDKVMQRLIDGYESKLGAVIRKS